MLWAVGGHPVIIVSFDIIKAMDMMCPLEEIILRLLEYLISIETNTLGYRLLNTELN